MATYSSHVGEPSKHFAGSLVNTHIRQSGKKGTEDNRNKRKTFASRAQEDLGGIAGSSETV